MATIPNAIGWPGSLQREKSVMWQPDFQNQSTPQALDGTRQYRSMNGGGLWRCWLNGVAIRTEEQSLDWFQKEVQLRGGLEPVDVPLCAYGPKQVGGSPPVLTAISGGWAARALTGHVSLANATALKPGMHFSDYDAGIYGWRLYRIVSVSGTATDYTIVFWPPARFAAAGSHVLEIVNTKCVMRLTSSDSMDIEMEMRRRGNPSAAFEEAF